MEIVLAAVAEMFPRGRVQMTKAKNTKLLCATPANSKVLAGM